MIQKFVYSILKRRHFWRYVGFNELSELYISLMFRNLALSLVGIFVPIYLWSLGFSLITILVFFGTFFTARSFWDIAAGYMVARFGPRHTLAASYVVQIVVLAMFTSINEFHWPLTLLAITWSISYSLFFVSFHVDFSKIKHTKTGGEELGLLTIMERGGAVLGPVAGGLIAFFFGPQYMFLAAIFFFLFGLIPLFISKEPVRLHQKLNFRGLPLKRLGRDISSYIGLNVENNVRVVVWPLFIAIFIFKDNVFLNVGLVSSASILASLVTAKLIGKLIDDKKGHYLLRYSALLNSGVHLFRLFANNFGMALGINVVDESISTGLRMPYHKALYDAADNWPGYRIVYLTFLESISSFMKALMYWILIIGTSYLSTRNVFSLAFVLAALASWLILTERFKALRPRG